MTDREPRAGVDRLSIPDIPDDADNLAAALGYAKAGWYASIIRRGSR